MSKLCKSMVNIYIVNALGQNLAIVVKGQNLSFRVICQKIAMFEQLLVKFDPSLDRSKPEFFKNIKNHGPKIHPRGVIWVSTGLVTCQKKK